MFESDCFQLIIRQFISIAIAMLLKVPTFRISVCTTRGGILKGYSNIHTLENDRSKEHASGRASNIIDTSKLVNLRKNVQKDVHIVQRSQLTSNTAVWVR